MEVHKLTCMVTTPREFRVDQIKALHILNYTLYVNYISIKLGKKLTPGLVKK